jgi:hypothetical protein
VEGYSCSGVESETSLCSICSPWDGPDTTQAQAIIELRRQVASKIGGGRQSVLDVGAVQLHVRYETPFGPYDTMDVMAIVVEMR